MSASASQLLKTALRNGIPAVRGGLMDSAAIKVSSNSNYYHAGISTVATSRHMCSSAAAAEYNSPMSDYLNLAVQGVAASGTTKYRPMECVVLKCGIPEDHLSFKTAAYGRMMMAPYVQQHEHKVIMTLHESALPLNEFEKSILAEIVGARYTPENGFLRLTCNTQGSRIENKRHLVSMLDRIVFAARKLAKEVTEEKTQSNAAAEKI